MTAASWTANRNLRATRSTSAGVICTGDWMPGMLRLPASSGWRLAKALIAAGSAGVGVGGGGTTAEKVAGGEGRDAEAGGEFGMAVGEGLDRGGLGGFADRVGDINGVKVGVREEAIHCFEAD